MSESKNKHEDYANVLHFLRVAKTNAKIAATALTDDGETDEAAMAALAALDALDRAIEAAKVRLEATERT